MLLNQLAFRLLGADIGLLLMLVVLISISQNIKEGGSKE